MTIDTNTLPETTTTPEAEGLTAPPSAEAAAIDEEIDEYYPRFPRRGFPQLRPKIKSRWVACIAKFDEDVTYRDFDQAFGIAQPAIIRIPASLGPAYAASCVGVQIACYEQQNGLHTGMAILEHSDGRQEFIAPRVGYIEEAIATPTGITAVLAILSTRMDEDLRALAERGELRCAQICMLQRMTAVPHRTSWGICVWTVQRTRARLCQFTSMSHVAGQAVIRQMELGEPLSPQDLLPTERRWSPAAYGRNAAGDSAAVVTDLNPGSITSPKRASLGSTTATYSLDAAIGASTVVVITHNLGFKPILVVVSNHANVIGNASSADNMQVAITFVNLEAVAKTNIVADVYYF